MHLVCFKSFLKHKEYNSDQNRQKSLPLGCKMLVLDIEDKESKNGKNIKCII